MPPSDAALFKEDTLLKRNCSALSGKAVEMDNTAAIAPAPKFKSNLVCILCSNFS
jgi:hypothetical protein